MLFSARVKELETQLAALTGERDQLAAANSDLVAANEECRTRHEADQSALTALTAERDQIRAELTTISAERDRLQTELAAEREGREAAIAQGVTQRLAATGGVPIPRDPKALVDSPTQAQTPRQRHAAHINQSLAAKTSTN